MAEEKVTRDALNKLLRQRRLQVNNAKKEIFPLMDQFVGRERNEELAKFRIKYGTGIN